MRSRTGSKSLKAAANSHRGERRLPQRFRSGRGAARSVRFVACLVALLAGCVAPSAPPAAPLPDAASLAAAIGEPVQMDHNHTDAAEHTGKHGLSLVNWSALIPQELGKEGFAGLRLVGDLAFLATDGDHAGFLIVNVSDPAAPKLVAQYATPGGASQEAVPTPDGNWVFLNLQRQPAAQQVLAAPLAGDGMGIQIVDTHDKAHPTLAAFVPVEVQGSHVMFFGEWRGKQYLIYNGQPAREGLPTGQVYTEPVGNNVKIAQFEVTAAGPVLVPVSTFVLPDALAAQKPGGCFPHDQWAQEHPLTHQWLLYVAFWDCGAVLVDITDPATPTLLHVDDVMAPSTRNNIHFFRPDPSAREGKVVAWSGPEIDLSPGEPGYLRAYDVTKPASFGQIGHWRLPGRVENNQPFLMSPHNFDFRGDLMAVAHYHAGVWVLNVSDPTQPFAVAFYEPHGNESAPFQGQIWRKTPNFPEAYFPNVYDAKWFAARDGQTYLLVSERGSGLYALKLDAELAPMLG